MGSSPSLKELGRRLSARRLQACMDAASLAARARLSAEAVERFERGEGGLGVPALDRLAKVLGVDSAEFMHSSVQVSAATVMPSVLLKHKQRGAGELEDADLEFLIKGLGRARSFVELGSLLRVERLAERFQEEQSQPSPAPQKDAHQDGYRYALGVRQWLPERTGPLRGLRRLIENRFDVLVLFHAFGNRDVLGASCQAGKARLIVVSSHLESEAQRRFVLAHELAHHLLDLKAEAVQADTGRSLEPKRFWNDNPPIEKRANAFAAMLLAPEPQVREVFGPPNLRTELFGSRDLVIKAKHHFGCSFPMMAWHLKNLKYSDERTVEALLATEDPTDISGFEEDTPFDGLARRVREALEREMISRGRARELLGFSNEELLDA